MNSLTVSWSDAPQPDWPALARAGEFYHDPRWVNALARSFGYRMHCASARRNGGLEGILALAEVPALFGPRRLVSLPFSYAAGPLAESEEVVNLLLDSALERARSLRIRRLEVKQAAPAGPPRPGYFRSERYATYRIPAADGAEAVFRQLHDSVRRGVRKAEKAGMVAASAPSESDWLLMAALEEETARGHGVPAPPRRFFTETCAGLQRDGLADLYLVRRAGEAVAGGVVIWKGPRRWIYAFGASRPEALEERPNHALLWTALRAALTAGVEFDLGRAAPEQTGLVEFKRRWGGVAVPLAYDQWPASGGLQVADRASGPLALAADLWRRLPPGLARAGARLYRYLG